jgi:hypothetical protein
MLYSQTVDESGYNKRKSLICVESYETVSLQKLSVHRTTNPKPTDT